VIVVDETVCERDTVYVPVPPLPPTNAVMVVPLVTPDPESAISTSSTPDVTAETVRVVPEIAPTMMGAVKPITVVLAKVCDTLTVTKHGNELNIEHEPIVTIVPAATLPPESVMPTVSVPEATADTEKVVLAISPVTDALGKDGAAPRFAGQ